MTEAAGPDYGIIVDPNFEFGDLSNSLRLADALQNYNIEAFEDPFQYLPGWHQCGISEGTPAFQLRLIWETPKM